MSPRHYATQYETLIYCGTYAKYNEGSLFGEWLNLSDYCDKEEFWKACTELHNDEEDPEIMFQDWEGPFSDMIGESWISDLIFDIYSKFEPCQFEALKVFLSLASQTYSDINELRTAFEDAYMGEYDSEIDFAESVMEEEIHRIPQHLQGYFDYKSYACDLFMDGFSFEDGHVFRF